MPTEINAVRADGTAKRRMLAALLQQKAQGDVSTQPLSVGQKALWFLHQSAPDVPAYHVAFAGRLRGALDRRALRSALQSVFDRHALLRATFEVRDGTPIQLIHGYRPVQLTEVECPGLSDDALSETVAAAYAIPFDLEKGPLFRADLFALSQEEHVLLITVHHIVYDAWSLWLNIDELCRFYAAEIGEGPAQLPVIGAAYRTFVDRQEALVASPQGEALWQFWKGALAGEIPLLSLPMDKPRPPVRGLKGASMEIRIPAALSGTIKQVAKETGATVFATLLAAYQVLLHRFSGQERVLVGSRSSGRRDPHMANTVGYFVNPIVIPAEFHEDRPFTALLRETQERVVAAMENDGLPFPTVVERLKLKRDPSATQLFQASFVMQRAQTAGSAMELMGGARTVSPGLDLEYFDIRQQEGQFDVDFEMFEAGAEFRGFIKYDPDLFSPEAIARLGDSYVVLLQSIAADPTESVERLRIVTEADRAWIAERDHPPAGAEAPHVAVHRLFEQRAAARPDDTALLCEGRSMTYGELDRRANQLAHHIATRGAKPGDLIGLCLNRSIEMVVALVGILKAGCAYLPLDPALPEDRISYILSDSGAALIVTESGVAQIVAAAGGRLVHVDAAAEAIAREPTTPTGIVPDADQLIYIMYTSGTTGRPKGVQITHRNVARLFASTQHWYRFGPDDVFTLFHSFAFDVSVWELWAALTNGGRIVIVPYLVSRSPAQFVELVDTHKVTVLNQSPSAFRLFAAEEADRPLSEPLSLRLIIFAGEALDLQSLKPWFARHGEVRPLLVNMYGITETTVHAMYREVSAADCERAKSTIGVAIPDLRISLLDKHLRPVPPGVPGEIHVSGPGLSPGYHGRPDLNAEKFLTLPDGSGARVYRSGDSARYLSNGDIEYLGRIDKQVKIRGFRIELGEIETVLCQHPMVSGAVVVPVDTDSHGRILVAYLVAGDGSPTTTELRQFLSGSLPDYMIPSAFMMIEAVPLTSNGKLDYRALPAPEMGRDTASELIEPRDATEITLAAIWRKVLKLDTVGVRDDFFALGGHSLLAVGLTAEMAKAFGRDFPISALFRNPTIETLADLVRTNEAVAFTALVPIRTEGEKTPFFCVAGGGGNVIYYHRLAEHLAPGRPFYGLQAPGVDGHSAPATSVEAVADVCLAAILQVRPEGPYLLGGHCFGGLVAFEIAQKLRRLGKEVQLVAIMDAPAPIRMEEDSRLNQIDGEDDDVIWISKVATVLTEGRDLDLHLDVDDLRRLDRDGRLMLLSRKLQELGILPEGDVVPQIRGFINVFTANSKIRYRPRDTLPVPIALLRAHEFHPDYDYSAADDTDRSAECSTLGWKHFALGEVSVDLVQGNHITMLSDGNVRSLSDFLIQRLDISDSKSD